jgi:nicotinamide mononucleotide transporter
MSFFSIDNIAINIGTYPLSYVELIGTLFGLVSVYLATRANILTWITGIVNEIFLFSIFFQVQLYADMLLQVFFFVVTIFGWYHWSKPKKEIPISESDNKARILYLIVTFLGTLILGFLISNLHVLFPNQFQIPADFPFIDSFVMAASMMATYLLAKKKIESWVLWILVDIICVFLFYIKGVSFLALEYLIFLGMASYGLFNWKKQVVYD